MSHFTPAEIEYFASQRLGRLATVSASGGPARRACKLSLQP